MRSSSGRDWPALATFFSRLPTSRVASLEALVGQGRLQQDGTRWHLASRTSKEDALKKLFGDG